MTVVSTSLIVLVFLFLGSTQGEFTEPNRPSTGTLLYLQPAVASDDNPNGNSNNMDTIVNNFTAMAAGFFTDTDTNILWCQSANNGTTIGEWYFPNGARVPTEENAGPLHVYHARGQIGLLRDAGISGNEGLYRCVIPDENGVNQTLWIGLYRTVPYNTGNGDYSVTVENPMVFSLSSADSIDSDPPVFTLSFNVTGYPPSTVTCSIDGSDLRDYIDIDREVITSPFPSRVLVTVTVTTRQSGTYTCTVNTIGPDGLPQPQTVALTMDDTDGLNITVTDSPVNVTGTRTGICQAILSWSPPVSNTPIVQGYKVFYNSSDGSRLSVDVGTNTTTVTLTTLDPELSYSVFVVAYGGDLPSNASNTVIISEVFALSANAPDDIMLQYGENVLVTCTLTISVKVSFIQLVWIGSTLITSISESFDNGGSGGGMMITPDNMMMTSQYSVNLTLNNVMIADAGLYTCGLQLTDTIGKDDMERRDHKIFIQIPNATVSINVFPGTSVNRTFISGQQFLLCSAKVPVIDVSVGASFTWYGPNGTAIIEGDKYQTSVSVGDGVNDDTHTSQLNISNLEISDNLTMYYCQVEVDVDMQTQMNYTNFTIPSVAVSEPVTIIVEALPSPVVTISVEGSPIIGNNFTLTCSAVYDVSLSTVSYQWQFNGSSLSTDSVLTIVNVTASDQGEYMCTATLSFNELLDVPGSTSSSDTYQFFTLGDPEVEITATGSIVAGNMYSLTCNVRVISGTPNISWFDPYGVEVYDNSLLTLEDNGNNLHRLILQFQSLNYTDIGEYTCIANLSVPEADFIGTGSDEYTVNIQIPTPNVSISTDSSTVRGTQRSITCQIDLNTPLPTMGYNVTLDWIKDGVTFDNSSSTAIEGSVEVNGYTYTSTIRFNPLNTTDTGDYECRATVDNIEEDVNILSSNNTATQRLDVSDIPEANVTLSSSGTGIAGDPYSLTCVVMVGNEDLIGFSNNLTLVKMTANGYDVLNHSIVDTAISVTFSPLTTADGGIYKCSYSTGNDVINYQRTFEDTLTTTVSIPSPDVFVSTDPVDVNTPLIEGTYINLVCNVSITSGVNTNITVDIEWTRNGVTINDGSNGYSISSVMMVSDNYISTVRIEELAIGDNNAVYRCSASVTPSISTFINGSNGNDSFTTTVREFVSSDVDVSISFSPSIPTGGDQFNLTCSITVPDRLVDSPSSIAITYDNGAQMKVSEVNSDATQTDILHDGGSVFYKVLTINPVKTSDGRKYYCQVAFGEPLDETQQGSRDLSVNIPSPSMSIALSPDGTIYESTLLVITCNATLSSTVVNTGVTATVTWTGPNGIVNNNNRITVSPATSIVDNVTYQSQLTFNPVDNGNNIDGQNDAGDYICEMTISSNDNLILTSMNNITDTVTVTNLPDLQVSISTIGSTTVGESLNITCTVVLVEGIVGNINVTWDKMDDVSELEELNLSQEEVKEGAVINRTLIMDPVQFDYRGVYMCVVEYNFTQTHDEDSASATEILIVDFPPFDVSISQDFNDPLYTGTPLTISCDITLSSLVDIPVSVTTTWTRDGAEITENTITDTLMSFTNLSHNATLDFYPINYLTDDGNYQCLFDIVTVEYVTNISNSASTELDVLDLPVPVISISRSSSSPSVGDSFEYTCNVSVVDRLIVVSPEIMWTRIISTTSDSLSDDISVVPDRTGNELSLDFNSLNTSDTGRYTCEAILNITEIDVTRSSNSSNDLILEIPSPLVTVNKAPPTLLAGSNLTLYCDIIVDMNVNTPFMVDTVWTRANDGNIETLTTSSSGRVTVYNPYSTGFNQYQSRIEFSTLSNVYDTGNYTCDVTIDSSSDYTFIIDSDNETDSTAFQIINPVISNFTAFPDMVFHLETSCPDSDPYDNFTLTCTASKQVIVLPELELFWLHNGTLRTDNSVTTTTYSNSQVYTVNRLTFNTTTLEDAGSYECVARLIIPESENINRSEISIVDVTAARRPDAAVVDSVTVTTTSVSIVFTIPQVLYTREEYRVEINGQELQNYTRNSTTISQDMISVEDQQYSITLTGLEESNNYTYTIVSTNCIGETRTDISYFKTYPDSPSGMVLDCMNTTFNSRDVTLTWNPPLRELQNDDELTGYDLICDQQGSDMSLPDTNETSDSIDTTVTLTDITPFRNYNCSIAAINSVGVGPTATCVFTTAQDVPSDAPQNFSSTPDQVSTVFTWSPPSIPNGIITEYSLTVSIFSTPRDSLYSTTTYPITDPSITSMRIQGLMPYQRYDATVSARTVVGFGPEASTSGITDPDMSSAVILYTVNAPGFEDLLTLPAVDLSTLNVTWWPPMTPNGRISSYKIDVINRKGEANQYFSVPAVDGQTSYTHLVGGLRAGVPYYVTIGAVNQVGQGENVSVTAFTGPGDNPPSSPENVMSDRSEDGTEITVSWDRMTLEDAGGFFNTLVTLDGGSRKRQTSPTEEVPYTESSVTFTGLVSSTSYAVTVMTVVTAPDGMKQDGPTSEPLSITPNPGQELPTSDNTAIIAVAVAVPLAILLFCGIIILVIIICVCRSRSSKGGMSLGNDRLYELPSNGGSMLKTLSTKPSVNDENCGTNGGGALVTSFAPLHEEPDDQEDDKKEDLAAYLEAERTIDRSNPVAKTSFHEHVLKLHEEADKEFESEYKSVPMATDSSIECATSEANKLKNRFSNIFPYDYSRVKLTVIDNVPDSDYINASYVDGYNRKDCYVCAQGPLPTTLGDFWRMIWEKKITNLVMLTGVVEGGKKKCEQYWPENVGDSLETQSGLNITVASRVPFSDYTIHSLKVSKADGSGTPLDITHFHYTAWPDHGVPQFATSLIGFINRVQKCHDKTKGIPLLVHCSAGVGRTGTFVMLDSMMDRLRIEDSLNVYEFLKQMRGKRMYMVQTLAQYVFLHDALDEYITCGETDISASNLKVRVSKMHKIIPSKNISGFQEQFQLLEQVSFTPNESYYSDAVKPFNAPKNRYPEIVPLNLNRPRLRPDGSEGSDYINASCVDGYKQRNAYLVTQGPLKSTAEDFWRMVVEFKSRSLVMLCNMVEEGQEKCYMYWPTKEGEPVEYGKHKVTLQSETVSGDYIIRKLQVINEKSSNKAEREGIVVTQFHYTQWPEHGYPALTGQVIEMIDILTRNQMNTSNKPITVVCNDGIGRSGAFLCIHSQLERLKTEGEIDVFKYLKSAKTKRIGLVSEIDQYVFIHQVLADYVESFDPYSNFKN